MTLPDLLSSFLACRTWCSERTLPVGALLLFVFLLSPQSKGQSETFKSKKSPNRPAEIVDLLGEARLAPPELSADVFLRVVEAGKISDPEWKREIIQEAFRRIEEVKNPVQLRPVQIRGVALNNTEGYLIGVAHAQKLDRLSLKGRGIKLLLRYDKDRAKQIVFSIGGRLDLKPRRCEDQLVFDVAEIYAAVGDVAKASFNEKETSEGVRALFVTPWIENLDSPVQIQPAFNLLMRLQGPPIERELLYHALARGINRNFGDDRSFAFAANVGLVSKEGSLTSDESRWAADLRLAYRDYLLKNLRGSRCKDHQLNEGENLPAFIGVANRLFPDRPITFEDLTAFEYKGEVMANDLVAMSDSLRELRQELLALKKEAQPTATADGKSDEAWPIKVNAFVERIRSWEPKEKFSQFDRFRVGITMLLSVLESIQDGDLKVAVVRRTLQTLNDSAIQRSNFVEWLYHVNRVRTAYPNEFAEIAPQIPNQSFSVILASKRLGV